MTSQTFKNVRAIFVAAQSNAELEQTLKISVNGSSVQEVTFTGKGEGKPMFAYAPAQGYTANFETNSGDTGDIELEMSFSSSNGPSAVKQTSKDLGAGYGNLDIYYYGSEDGGGTDFNDTVLTIVAVS